MSYVVVMISFSLWTIEFQINEEVIVSKVTSTHPEFALPTNEILILDQKTGKVFTVHAESHYLTKSLFTFSDTGWKSDQYETNQIEFRPVGEGAWECIDIIEFNTPSDSNPFGSDGETKKITRVCKIPEIEHLIQREAYYKFLGFYRTDIELPLQGIVTKQWMVFPADDQNAESEFILSRLTEIKEMPGTPPDIEDFLKWPIQHK